jgi:hypothetical protein
VIRAGVIRFASDLRSQLAGPAPSALDLVVAERVVLGWVFLNWAEWQYAALASGLNLRQSDFHLRRIDMAHRKLMTACRTLAKVKKAKLPDVLALVNVNPPTNAGAISPQMEAGKQR